jgi:phytoene synthase
MIARDTSALSPPHQLAVAYARSDLRAAWSLLLEFDNRMMAIAFKGQEPVLKQMRLAWWREQLAKSVADRPKGEPLLARLSRMPNAGQVEIAAATLIDAWEELITDDGDSGAGLQKCADLRADAIFASYAGWVGSNVTAATDAGRAWALADLGGSPQLPRKKLSGQLKPLNLLLFVAAVEQSDGRFARLHTIIKLYFHALTGL